MSNVQKRLAVLIDADNSPPSIIEGLLDEIAQYGVASVKRIYGDWTDTKLKGWKKNLLDHGIQPMQQFAYTTGKNATDSAMIIDAMDLLYTKNFDGFCLVSSDSDFTRLASRIREAGLMVYGLGQQKTPKAFVSACDKFIYTENFAGDNGQAKASKKTNANGELLQILRRAVEDTADLSGWSNLGAVGQNISNKLPDFDPRTYGFRKLRDLVESMEIFEFKGTKAIYIRCKRQPRSYEK